ncbi:MAG TPA: SIMPL domain-containing protein [Asanoa sp.]|nr:SIMPL domain-containing protein [Asanoa sp.]
MIERPWGVTAYGAASVKALPDLVRVRFKIVRMEQTAPAAFEAASAAVRDVRRALRDHGVPDAAVEGSRLDLRTFWAYPGNGPRTFVGYQCQAAFAVESTELNDVEPLLVDLVAAGANEVEGVDFDVIAKQELRGRARQRAVAAARAKAELYAAAAGVRLGALLHIDDVDPEQVGNERYRGHRSTPDTASDQDLAPGHVVVSAAVTLGYALARD